MSSHVQTNIGLSGHKGSGKSTVAQHLQTLGYQELGFADPLKRLVIDIFQIDPKYVYDPEWKETVIDELGVSGRALCQVIGSELFRDALPRCLPQLKLRGGSVWIHSLLKRAEKIKSATVVSDCRFANEYEALHQAGFEVYKIDRPSLVQNSTSSHQSEQGCPFDKYVLNDGGIPKLLKNFNR